MELKDLQLIVERFTQKIDDEPEEMAKLSDYERCKQDGYKDIIDAIMIQLLEDMKNSPDGPDSGIEDW